MGLYCLRMMRNVPKSQCYTHSHSAKEGFSVFGRLAAQPKLEEESFVKVSWDDRMVKGAKRTKILSERIETGLRDSNHCDRI